MDKMRRSVVFIISFGIFIQAQVKPNDISQNQQKKSILGFGLHYGESINPEVKSLFHRNSPIQRLLECSGGNCATNNNSDICAPGCYYSAMQKGLCDKSCSGTCFGKCDSTQYCSAGCSFSSLEQGDCSEVCNKTCLKLCKCKEKCSRIYKATYTCPEDCSQFCCNKESNYSTDDSKSFELLGIILGIILGCILVLMKILCIYKHRKLRNASLRQQTTVFGRLPTMQNTIDEILKSFGLAEVSFSEDLQFSGEKLCTVDLNEINQGDMVVITGCKHIFHSHCLSEWLEKVSARNKCPNCNNIFIKCKEE